MTTYRYRIINWDTHFETSASRKLKHPYWVSIPNKQSGKGFTRIMAQEDGPSIFGVWILIVEACSSQTPPRAGWLTDDGTATGIPWTIEDLAEKWRCEPAVVARALDVLCSPKVGWVEPLEDGVGLVGESATVLGESPGSQVKSGQVQAGQGRAGAGAHPAPGFSTADNRDSRRREIRLRLARLRLASDETGLEEWIGLLTEEAGCLGMEECCDCLNWLKAQGKKNGITSRYASAYEVFANKWRKTYHTENQGKIA